MCQCPPPPSASGAPFAGRAAAEGISILNFGSIAGKCPSIARVLLPARRDAALAAPSMLRWVSRRQSGIIEDSLDSVPFLKKAFRGLPLLQRGYEGDRKCRSDFRDYGCADIAVFES